MEMSPEGYVLRPRVVSPHQCRDLASRLMESSNLRTNGLSIAFDGSRGIQATFKRSGLEQLSRTLGVLLPFFELTDTLGSNAFFMNVLVVHNRFSISPHFDCSLNTYTMGHSVPTRVSVLYVQVPEDMLGGELELYWDSKRVATINPIEGLLVHFRGDYAHAVAKGTTNSERISLVLEEYSLDEEELALVPDFSIVSALQRSPVDMAKTYGKALEFVQSLTDEERLQLRAMARSGIPPKSKGP